MEQKILRKTYMEKIKNLKEINISEYLQQGFKLSENILKEMEYFKTGMPKELKEIILKQSFWDLYYNRPMEELIIKSLKIANETEKRAIGTFVYCYQTDKRDFEEKEDADALKVKLIGEGYTEEKVYANCLTKEEILNTDERLKKLNGLKVVCVFDKDKIGIMGSFTAKEQHEGKLIFEETRKALFFMPKKHTKTGQILRSKFYYKELNNSPLS